MKKKVAAFLVNYYQPLIISVLMLIISSYFAIMSLDPGHDGIMFKPALDVVNGKMLFKESFAQYGALSTLMQALAIKIFGEYVIVIRLLTTFFYSLIGFLLWIIWSRFLPKWLSTISCLIWICLAPYYFETYFFCPWSSVYALFFLLLSCYFLIKYIENSKEILIFISGISASLAFWCRQPIGIFLIASLLLFLLLLNTVFSKYNLKKSFKTMALFLIGVIASSSCFFIWLIANGALKDWWLQQIYFAFIFASDTSGQNSLIKEVFSCLFATKKVEYLTCIWSILPIVCILLFIYLILFALYKTQEKKTVKKATVKNKKNNNFKQIREFSKLNLIILALLFASFASWMQYYPVLCIRHVYWSVTPMIGIFSYCIWLIVNHISKSITTKTIISLVLILSFFSYDIEQRIVHGYAKTKIYTIELKKPSVLSKIKLSKDQSEFYTDVNNVISDYLAKYPDRNIVTVEGSPLYLTFKENNYNFHPLYVLWSFFFPKDHAPLYPDYYDKLNKYISEKKPIILAGSELSISGYKMINKFHLNNTPHNIVLFKPIDS